MKKTILAGLLLATFSTSFMSANTKKLTDSSEEKFCCWYAVSYETKQEGSCTVTYKVVTKYFLCCRLASTRTVSSKSCVTNPGGSGGPGNPGGSSKK
ncbi:hypothetical protein [Chryseobacterium lathyri]|uniref:Uncharacterized protein n=1 Tax=Chryseobacterium lathyri TaxID=395933 RepID=A0ABT9SIW4_9FLAO|nr:hypothetical protein [Chryseobacterium lathyri]MDP9958766.1 hypothetical protein [Chryseobacterium lathyri]